MAKRATALGRSVLSEVTNQLRHKLLIQKMACERSKIEIEPQVMLHRLNNSKRSAFITPRVSVLDFTALPELASAEQTVAFRSELLQHVVHKFNQNKMRSIVDKSNSTSDGVLRSFVILEDDIRALLNMIMRNNYSTVS